MSDGSADDKELPSPDKTLSTDSDLEEEVPVTDTVAFKCIGVTRDNSYQDALKSVNTLLKGGKGASVRVEAEPTNPFDARAVCFKCLFGSEWKVCGYVVKELCDDMNEAMENNNIVSVEFCWVKYKILRTSGPGYYAAINVTRKGKWSPRVYRFASTMY